MFNRLQILLLLSLMIFDGECRCGDRLERALDIMQQRGNSARRRFDSEEADQIYHERLRSAPIDISVMKIVIEIPQTTGGSSRDSQSWAKVERCLYEPSNNSIRTRVGFNELAVSGLVQLVVHDPETARLAGGDRLLPAESCRMSLRLRRAGMEFYTSPIARGRGQMRIRTESSFLEPRFASIYAYGCRPVVPVDGYDRGESEPRKREIAKKALSGLKSSESNSVSNSASNSTAYEDEEDSAKEENRLPLSSLSSSISNDALLDSLWRSRGDIAREMEDVFLRSSSQAITHYIEKQLHPAIKETLMVSMGYTVSYG